MESPLRRALRDDSWTRTAVERLSARVGGIDALEALTTEPLTDVDFDWSAASGSDRDLVVAVLNSAEACLAGERNVSGASLGLPPLIDDEYRTIVWRLLARIGQREPAALRKSSPPRMCAALFWIAIRASDGFGRHSRLTVDYLWKLFGVSACSDLAQVLLGAAGFPQHPVEPRGQRRGREVRLADPRLLHSDERTYLVKEREQLAMMIVEDERRRDEGRPIQLRRGGVELRGRPVVPRWATRGNGPTGKAVVMTVFGDDEDHVEILAMSVPDARRLIDILEQALNLPFVPPAQGPRSV